MKKRLLIFGIIFLTLIFSSFATITIKSVPVQTFESVDGTVNITFDEQIILESITIGQSSILITKMIIPSCSSYVYTKNITTSALSSTFGDDYCAVGSVLTGSGTSTTTPITLSPFVELGNETNTTIGLENKSIIIDIVNDLINSSSEINLTSLTSDLSEMYFFNEKETDNKIINVLDKVFTVLGLSIIIGILCTLLIFNIDKDNDWLGGSFLNFVSRTGLSIIITIIVTVLLWVLHITLN